MRMEDWDLAYHQRTPEPVPEEELDPDLRNVKGWDPLMASFLPLEDFDNDELDPFGPGNGHLPPPPPWVCPCGAACAPPQRACDSCGLAAAVPPEGHPAHSKYHASSDAVDWMPCHVLAFDDTKEEYLIRWDDTAHPQLKRVKRLNLVFDEEDPRLWQVSDAHKDRSNFFDEGGQWGGGWDGMGVCPTPARHIAGPTTRIGWPCRRLPCAGLGATQTTTDPVRDWRSEVSSRFLGVALPGLRSRCCFVGKGHGSGRHEPARVHEVSREQALVLDLTFHRTSCRSKSSGGGGGGGTICHSLADGE